MEVYNQIKKDLGFLCLFLVVWVVLMNTFNVGIDDTDKDGWNRSGVALVTDYETGVEYLYRGGALIYREKQNEI